MLRGRLPGSSPGPIARQLTGPDAPGRLPGNSNNSVLLLLLSTRLRRSATLIHMKLQIKIMPTKGKANTASRRAEAQVLGQLCFPTQHKLLRLDPPYKTYRSEKAKPARVKLHELIKSYRKKKGTSTASRRAEAQVLGQLCFPTMVEKTSAKPRTKDPKAQHNQYQKRTESIQRKSSSGGQKYQQATRKGVKGLAGLLLWLRAIWDHNTYPGHNREGSHISSMAK